MSSKRAAEYAPNNPVGLAKVSDIACDIPLDLPDTHTLSERELQICLTHTLSHRECVGLVKASDIACYIALDLPHTEDYYYYVLVLHTSIMAYYYILLY